jgi:Solitary outer membrane autotransporter beta-barrel domain
MELSRATASKPGFSASLAMGMAFLLSLAGTMSRAQSIPNVDLDQLDTAIGQRVEATAVLGTQSVVTRAGLGWTLNNASGVIYKIPWETEVLDPRSTGDTNLLWAPVCEGGVGYGEFSDKFNNSALAGNQSDYNTVAVSLGGGPRLYLGNSGFSVLPAFSLLYAYTENIFHANTPEGQFVQANGRYVNWTVQTLSAVPSFELRFKKTYGSWTPKFTSTFAYFNTRPIVRSTDALSFRSSSEVWANGFDLDYLTTWKPLDCPMHFGGDINRTDLYGGLNGAMGTDHYYQADGRITFDTLGRLWKIKYVGFDGGYFWCGAFSGYSVGLLGSMEF